MRWFKHFSDNHRGRTVQRLLDEVGHSGALAYYFILEMCAEKLEKTKGRDVNENDCVFVFNRKVIHNVTRMKRVTIDNVGIIGTECGVWDWKANGNEIIIKMPIMLDLLDRDLKGSRSRRAQDAKKPRPELDIESDIDVDDHNGQKKQKDEFINSAQKMENRFKDDYVKIKEYLKEKNLNSLRQEYVVSKLFEFYGSFENFINSVYQITSSKNFPKEELQQNTYLEVSLKRLIGLLGDKR